MAISHIFVTNYLTMNKMSLLTIPDKAYFDPLYGQANLMRIAGLKSKLMDLL